MSTKLLKFKLPNICFYQAQYKERTMEAGIQKLILAIDFNNISTSQIFCFPSYGRETQNFWKLFYGIDVKEFEQEEVSREILELFKQVFSWDLMQTMNPSKNIISYIYVNVGESWIEELDFYFENNKLQKIMRGWGNNKVILE